MSGPDVGDAFGTPGAVYFDDGHAVLRRGADGVVGNEAVAGDPVELRAFGIADARRCRGSPRQRPGVVCAELVGGTMMIIWRAEPTIGATSSGRRPQPSAMIGRPETRARRSSSAHSKRVGKPASVSTAIASGFGCTRPGPGPGPEA